MSKEKRDEGQRILEIGDVRGDVQGDVQGGGVKEEAGAGGSVVDYRALD